MKRRRGSRRTRWPVRDTGDDETDKKDSGNEPTVSSPYPNIPDGLAINCGGCSLALIIATIGLVSIGIRAVKVERS